VVAWPSVTIVTTAATPMMMPSAVRNERSLWRRIERIARMKVVPNIRRHFLALWCFVSMRSTSPSLKWTMVRANAAMSGSWVTISTVMPLVAVEIGEQLHDLDRAFGIEIAGRLVGEQHIGIGDDRAGDRDALLLAARKLGRRMVPPLLEPDLVERGHRRLVPLLLGIAAIEQRQLDILERGGAREQVEALEDEAEIFAPQQRALVAVERSTWTPLNRKAGLGTSRQPRMFIVVDLPDPDGPITATKSPDWMSRSTPFSAWNAVAPSP
jgi:hypothetical protein